MESISCRLGWDYAGNGQSDIYAHHPEPESTNKIASEAPTVNVTGKSEFWVDFNELIEPDLVALSNSETKVTRDGLTIHLHEGLLVDVYENDIDSSGKKANIVASGVVELNKNSGWSSRVRWCCRIDKSGIRHESDLKGD